jgi:hypothetical protein
MKALAAAMLVLASASHAATTRQLALIDGWQDIKQRAQRMRDTFLAHLGRDAELDRASFEKGVAQAWAKCESIELSERARRRSLSQELMTALALDRLDQRSYDERSAAVERLFAARMVFIYGNLFPRVLDESVSDRTGTIGRRFAAEWALAISQEEADALGLEFRQASGFGPDRASGPFPPEP